ncbi:MAG: VOC family protein, partial [Planctomycetota bacterium]|nr:VOC family protein [Planctomycetota bacterium]
MHDEPVGSIVWRDLTVDDAERVSKFYEEVVGWTRDPVSMGAYNDFNMMAEGASDPTAGVCHARGPNAGLPAQWLMYVRVADV